MKRKRSDSFACCETAAWFHCRTHRYPIRDVLKSRRANTEDIIVLVSAAILKRRNQYDQVLFQTLIAARFPFKCLQALQGVV